jgi:hypothetical protein
VSSANTPHVAYLFLNPSFNLLLSPQVPDVDWLVEKIQGFVDSGVLKGRPQHIWVNPDCGLKTRRWAEVIPSLRNMVEAAAIMRARIAGSTPTGRWVKRCRIM